MLGFEGCTMKAEGNGRRTFFLSVCLSDLKPVQARVVAQTVRKPVLRSNLEFEVTPSGRRVSKRYFRSGEY